MTPLPELSLDLWLMIGDLLDTTSVKRLAQTSKALYATCVPILYSKVDLSIHHAEPYGEHDVQGIIIRWPKDESIFGRQSLFMDTIFHQPSLAKLVRSFVWSMSLHSTCSLPQWASCGPSNREECDKPAIYNLENSYTLFEHLECVTSVDIFGGYSHAYPSRKIPSLFPQARSIQLSGQMHYALAKAILHGSDKAPLQSLGINYLHERGHTRDGENIQGTRRGRPCCEISGHQEETWDTYAGDLPGQLLPGDMIGLFTTALQARCENLQTFQLHTIGSPIHLPFHTPPGWRWRWRELHRELAAFFKHVHPREVKLIYGALGPLPREDIYSRYRQRSCLGGTDPQIHQNDLIPILLDGWPTLKRLEIEGGHPSQWSLVLSNELRFDRSRLSNVETVINLDKWDSYGGQLRTWDPFYKGLEDSSGVDGLWWISRTTTCKAMR
ncbi:hypothetical protein N7509_002679 [Penicillium cosmopolitanum]|uniref:Uncharacterized protein n=1 Tax=Penicillium cosmopolitanum TaxID=1131564 RepID=A0A9X0BDM6_9EURO|nr:uncharacterized protein N7509_002679 [Penicillium cosmopolitanum]KAJ5408796.1 hypothetical protein N7509_002679 [Penicillium cosmopolitanum]